MTLSTEDAAHFFKLYNRLEVFALNRSGLLRQSVTQDTLSKTDVQIRLKVRDALFGGPEIIDDYVRQNSDGLDAGEREIVRGWTRAITGNSFIERHLARHTIFIRDNDVYAVIGLYQDIRDVADYYLPVMVKAILLPFKGRIVYDGVLQPYSVSFGSGIRNELKETYLAARQWGKIIESLDPTSQLPQRSVVARDWKPEVEALLKDAKKLRAGKGAHPLQGPAFALVRSSLELALAVAGHPTDAPELEAAVTKADREMYKIIKIIERGVPPG
jgi:hypothetical protein